MNHSVTHSMNHLARFFIIIILGGLTLLLLLKLGDIDISLNTLWRINPLYLSGAILFHYSGFIVRGWRWQILLTGLGHHLTYLYTTTLLIAGWFISALVPARAGDLSRVYMLHRDHQIQVSQGLASIATERALDICTILVLTCIATTFILADHTPPWIWQMIGLGSLLFISTVMLLSLMPNLESWMRQWFTWSLYQKMIGFGFDTLNNIRRLSSQPILLLIVSLQSLYIWFCDVLLMHFAFLCIDIQIPITLSTLASLGADLAVAIPLMPGAMGQFEGAALLIFSLFDLPTQAGSLALLLNRFVSFWTFLIFSGLITYLFGFAQVFQHIKADPKK